MKIRSDAINEWGGLYRTQYLVLSRTLLEAMPDEWQERFVKIMEEVGEEFDFYNPDWTTPDYNIQAVGADGRYIKDPWGQYRYPNYEYIEKLRKRKEQP